MRYGEYPYNLIAAVIGHGSEESGYNYPPDVVQSLAYLLAGLKPAWRDVLLYRFRDRLTQDETANRMGISRQCARIKEAKALRELRASGNKRLLEYGVRGIIEMEIEEGRRAILDNVQEGTIGCGPNGRIVIKHRDPRNVKLQNMGLSGRAYGPLWRCNSISTAVDLVNLYQSGGIRKIRGIGPCLVDEIRTKLLELGFTEEELRERLI